MWKMLSLTTTSLGPHLMQRWFALDRRADYLKTLIVCTNDENSLQIVSKNISTQWKLETHCKK